MYSHHTISDLLRHATALRRKEEYAGARAVTKQAIAMCQGTECEVLGSAHALLGQLARDNGKLEESLEFYQKAMKYFRQGALQDRMAHATRHIADIECELGKMDEAGRHFVEALGHYRSSESGLNLANAIRGYALWNEKMEQHAEAGRLWKEAREIYAQANIAEGVQECDEHLGNLG